MRFNSFNQDKGVAGLTILLSMVTMLFVIGLLVTIFALMGGELAESDSVKASQSTTATDTSLVLATEVTTLTDCDGATNGAISSISTVYNDTTLVPASNYTYTGCVLNLSVGGLPYNESLENVTYTYTSSGASWDVMNDTTGSISSVTDWFTIFIVIGAMVVLILLTVIIITAIRGSGLMGDTTPQGRSNIGSA